MNIIEPRESSTNSASGDVRYARCVNDARNDVGSASTLLETLGANGATHRSFGTEAKRVSASREVGIISMVQVRQICTDEGKLQ